MTAKERAEEAPESARCRIQGFRGFYLLRFDVKRGKQCQHIAVLLIFLLADISLRFVKFRLKQKDFIFVSSVK